MPAHQDGADAYGMQIKNYATALPAAAGLAALLLTACSSGGSSTSTSHPASSSSASSHPAASTTTSPASAKAASSVTVTDQDDANWAGYLLANGATTTTTTTTSFSAISGSWTQPAADCAAGAPSYSAFWVGLGGYSGDHLEQAGTSADCSAAGQATYAAWYELVPAAQVPLTMTVAPGDHISAHVAVSGTTVTISLADSTRHTTVSKQLTMSDPTVSSAEWIAEAPSQCTSATTQDCSILPLADFGTVTFTSASATAAGRTGSITAGLAPVSALTLEANAGYGRLYASAAQADASPGALSGNGSSFTVTWQHPTTQTPTPPVTAAGPLYN